VFQVESITKFPLLTILIVVFFGVWGCVLVVAARKRWEFFVQASSRRAIEKTYGDVFANMHRTGVFLIVLSVLLFMSLYWS
jgi:hypothetical protein